MEPIAPAAPAPSKEELIFALSEHITRVIQQEMVDESDIDRIWLLRKFHKNYLYLRDLAYFAPALYQGLVDATGIDGSILPDPSWQGNGVYDYTQNIYKGYCRKLMAVLGTRIPNAVAVPNDPSDEADIKAARAANNAALYIRDHSELQVLILWLVFGLFNFGTCFWTVEWVVDGDENGYREVSQVGTEDMPVGGGFPCASCGATTDANQDGSTPPNCQQCGAQIDPATPYQQASNLTVPSDLPPQMVPKGSLEIDLTDGTEVSVPLDADGRKGTDGCLWIRREKEFHKARLLHKYGDALREAIKGGDENAFNEQTASLQYGESIRSAMASPIGVVRPRRENRWTVITEDWSPPMYEMVEDKTARGLLQENYPKGIRITAVKGRVIDLEERDIHAHWQECQPEPIKRIMCEPLGDDWVVTQDILNNLLNQQNEAVERSNEPGFADPTRVDLDAWQRRRDNPADLIPALRPPGGTLADLIYRPPPVESSPEIVPFRQQVEQTSQQTTGLLEIIWGGDNSDPTARQSELKTNAAIRQLSVIWVMIGKSLERVYEKACALLAEHEEGVLAFSKQKANEFGKFDSVAVVIEDLKGGNYHFEADEAIPMTWGQQRDLLMWMLDKPPQILEAFGYSDPMNVWEMVSLLGMPTMRVPHLDARDKGMEIISQLLNDKPVPGPADPQTGQPGPQQSSIQPDYEDDAAFMSKLVKAYLVQNYELKQSKPDGYENIVLYSKACDQQAQQPPQKPPVKATVALSLKGTDVGDPAVQAALQGTNIIP